MYPLLIVLVAIALGLENLLANKFYRRDAQADGPSARTLAAAIAKETEKAETVSAA
jgi:hypothetical protein